MKHFNLRAAAIIGWVVALAAIALAVTLRDKPGKLYPTFVSAGEHFLNGEPIYGVVPEGQDQYRYSPVVAAAFAPWSFLPPSLGSVLWRWAQALAFLFALLAWARTSVPAAPFAALAMLSLPLVIGNIFNAQLNPLVCALMLGGLAAFSRERYGFAGALIAAAAAFKVYPLALGLLLCVVETRRFAPRLVLALAVVCGLPFVLQDPEYVARQFADWNARIGSDDRTEQPIHKGYHDFQKLLRRWEIPTDLTTYRAIEVAAGCAAAAFVAWGRRGGWSRGVQVQACAGLGLVWCTLFGPATESATYMLLAPVAAYAVIAVTGRPLGERVAVRGAFLLLLSVPVALWFPRPISDPYRALIPQAHGAMILLGWVILEALRARRPACGGRGRSIAGRVLRRVSPARTTSRPTARVAGSRPSLPCP